MSPLWPAAARRSLASERSAFRPCARRCWLSRHSVALLAAAALIAAGVASAPAQEAALAAAGPATNADTATRDDTAKRAKRTGRTSDDEGVALPRPIR